MFFSERLLAILGQRYTRDYLLITQCATDQGTCEAGGFDGAGNPECHCNYDDQNALSHFRSTGQAAGYIWHSEVCNVDGTDIVIDRVPTPVNASIAKATIYT